jgi:hypothetical protein
VYRNEKPDILTPSPSSAIAINLNSPLNLSATISDEESFTVTITKGALSCTPNGSGHSPSCGLTNIVAPTTTGSFSTTFTSGSAFLGENSFQIKVTDPYGEFVTQDFTVTSNYFSNICNQLQPGQICTLVGLPGLGSGINLATDANKVRIQPTRIIRDERANLFFSDSLTNTVWYYNKTASPVTILNVTIPANTIYVVAGTGVAGAGVNGVDARKMAMSFGGIGGGLAWDSGRQELFIADYSNNRVLRVDSMGKARTICGLASDTTQGGLARNGTCSAPADLAFDVTNRRLYVTQLHNHVIKVINASDANFMNWTAWIIAGAWNACGNSSGTSNLSSFYSSVAGTGRICQPIGLYLDEADQILYWSNWHICRIGAIGLPGSTTRTIAGTTISPGQVTFLPGNNCGNPAVNVNQVVTNSNFNRAIDLHVHRTGGTINGIYVANQDSHRIMYLNNSASAVTIGGQTIAAGQVNNVFGNGTTNSPTNPPTGRNSVLNYPVGLLLDGDLLYVGAAGGSIIRTLNIATGTVSNVMGGTGRAGYSGNAALDSALVTLNGPLSLFYKGQGGSLTDPIPGNLLFVSDFNNFMIRSINLTTGRVEDFIGTGGQGNANIANTVTTSTPMINPRSMGMYNGFFLYNDTNNNCFTRAYNPFPTDETLFSTLINLNKTNTVAGNWGQCGNFVGATARSTTDLNARFNNPWGLGVDAGNGYMYVASYSSHCILRVSAAGIMEPFIGTCGTMAPSVVAGGPISPSPTFGTATLLRFPSEIVMDPNPGLESNFFFIDFTDVGTANIKYVNVSSQDVDFFGGATTVMANNIDTVLALVSSPGFMYGLAAYDDWVCYASSIGASGQNTVTCRNRETGTTQTFGVPGVGGIQLETEQEGASATSPSSTVTFNQPAGLAFDNSGNLYIIERGPHVIRKIRRWF